MIQKSEHIELESSPQKMKQMEGCNETFGSDDFVSKVLFQVMITGIWVAPKLPGCHTPPKEIGGLI